MKTPKRIDLSLFDDDLKTLISAATKKYSLWSTVMSRPVLILRIMSMSKL